MLYSGTKLGKLVRFYVKKLMESWILSYLCIIRASEIDIDVVSMTG